MKPSSNNHCVAFLFLTGFVSLLGQVILLRELNVAFFGIELLYALAFSIWLTGTALGALAGKRTYVPGYTVITMLFILSGLLLPADLTFIRCLHSVFGGVPGAFLPFDRQMIALTAALLPFSIVMGLLFQWCARSYTAAGGTLAKAYAVECFGSLTGGAASSLFLFAGMQNFQITLLCSAACFLTVFMLIKRKRTRIAAGFIAVLLVVLSFFCAKSVDDLITSAGFGRRVESTDTPYSRVTVAALDDQVSVFEDNALVYESETTDAEEFVQLASLQSSNPDKVLVLGGGFKGIVEELNRLPVSAIDYVDYNSKMIEFITAHLPPKRQAALSSPRVHMIFMDPRSWLRKNLKYDLILTGMPEPSSAQNSRFYTVEFFREIASCLNANGIFSFRIPSAENFWTPVLKKRNASIYKSLKSVFANVIVLPGASNIFIASNDPLTTDTRLLTERLLSRNLNNKLVIPQYVTYLYTNDRYDEINKMLNDGAAILNTDIRPVCYQYTVAIWLSKFFPQAALWNFTLPDTLRKPVYKFIAGLILVLVILAGRKWLTFRRSLIVFLAGFQGMVLELVLLLNYQMQNGILFGNIGVLLMAFMAGLSLGAWMVNKHRNKLTGIILIISSILICLLFGYLLSTGNICGFGLTFLSLAVAGFITSGLFAWAASTNAADQNAMISPLYAADLLGGVIGAVLANFMFIPMLGLAETAEWMAGVGGFLVFCL